MRIVQKKKIVSIFLFAVIFAVLLSGCMNILAEDLYSLPQLSEDYLRLQSKIDDILEQGAEFSPPISGTNRQAVQLRDLDGDGINEVVAFFSIPGEGVLKLYILTLEIWDYSVVEIIEIRGSAFDSVSYVDMDGDGIVEIVLGSQISPLLRQIEIFSIKDFEAVSLVRANYIDFINFDLTGDGSNDIIVISQLPQEYGIEISLYRLVPDGGLIMSSVRLSDDIEAFIQILTGRLIDDTPAVFVEGEVGSEEGHQVITEIFIFYDNELVSTTLNRD